MKSLGQVLIDYNDLTMEFLWQGQKVLLQAEVCLGKTPYLLGQLGNCCIQIVLPPCVSYSFDQHLMCHLQQHCLAQLVIYCRSLIRLFKSPKGCLYSGTLITELNLSKDLTWLI